MLNYQNLNDRFVSPQKPIGDNKEKFGSPAMVFDNIRGQPRFSSPVVPSNPNINSNSIIE
jgi:hypothetical protein